jgi:predicted amidohydrolase YtcJ
MLADARRGQIEAWRRGVTGFEDLDQFLGRAPLGVFERMRDAGELKLRVHMGIPHARLAEAIERGMRTGDGDDWLRTGHLKIFSDGALGSQTAALEEPYENSFDRGILTIDPATLAHDVALAAASGIAVAIHAIGDRAVRVALDAIAPTRKSAPQLRQKIEHVQLVRAADLARFGALGIIASMQPIHATSDRDLADRYWGASRVTRAYPWRTLRRGGAVLAFGSDAPVEPIDPLLGIHATVARWRPGDKEPWRPEQRLTLDEALAGYAAGPAYAMAAEKTAGTLRVGMRCDATVVDRDLARCSEGELLAARVRATITDGMVRFADGLG